MPQDIPPDLMKMMQGGGAEANMPPASPDTAPQENAGQKMQAQAKVQMAMTILEQSLVAFGAGTDEGRCVLDALTKLSKQFGTDREKGRELIPSEIMNLVGGMPGGAGGSPMAPPGGGAPGGGMMPPGGGMQGSPGGMPGMA